MMISLLISLDGLAGAQLESYRLACKADIQDIVAYAKNKYPLDPVICFEWSVNVLKEKHSRVDKDWIINSLFNEADFARVSVVEAEHFVSLKRNNEAINEVRG